MPSARIHEAIAKELNKEYHFQDELLLRIGTVAPDSWRNVDPEVRIKDKYLSHFWDFRKNEGQANNYEEFYLKYYNHLSNPFYFGYLIHLIGDQYWKTYIDPKYVAYQDGIKGCRLKDGSFHDDENYYRYYESLKVQKNLAKIYELGLFPIEMKDIPNLNSNIDELSLDGLFGNTGTLHYINEELTPKDENLESEMFDINVVVQDICKTKDFIKKELERLEEVKIESDKKVKIAVDIDDTLLHTTELRDYYWQLFLQENPMIDPNKDYKWGDIELAKFWAQYREQMAFGEVMEGAEEALTKLIENDNIVDLLSARPLDKYVSLKRKLVDYLEEKKLHYRFINLGFYSKKEFLEDHHYDILIDNDIRNVKEAKMVGTIPILFGESLDYDGYQTNEWRNIPTIVEKIKVKKH